MSLTSELINNDSKILWLRLNYSLSMVYSYSYFPQYFSIGKNISTKVADGMPIKPHLTDTSAIRQDITDEYKYRDGIYITLFSSAGYLVICVYRHFQ